MIQDVEGFCNLKSVMQMSGLVIVNRSLSSLGAGFQAPPVLNLFFLLFLVCLVSLIYILIYGSIYLPNSQ